MSTTKIEWTDRVWNPVRGCSIVSAGCTNCYAMREAARWNGPGQPYKGLTKRVDGRPVWTGEVRVVMNRMVDPLRWRKPSRVFVNSMSDLFHEKIPDEWIVHIFEVMATASALHGHQFQVLTKRPDRMRELVPRMYWRFGLNTIYQGHLLTHRCALDGADIGGEDLDICGAPPGVWLGVSVEDQMGGMAAEAARSQG